MMKDQHNEKSGVADISRMYVGKHQREALRVQAYAKFRRKGYSHNQAKALAAQAVDGFLAQQRQQQIDAITQAEQDSLNFEMNTKEWD